MTDELENPQKSAEPGQNKDEARRKRLGRIVGVAIVVATVVLVVLTLITSTANPRTEDASVGAHYIGVVPEVEGRIRMLHAADNGCVKAGDLLVEIESEQYEYALRSAQADQAKLEQEIVQEEREVRASEDQVRISTDTIRDSRLEVRNGTDQVNTADAQLKQAHADFNASKANYALAEQTVARNEPLAARNYISQQSFDQMKTQRDDARDALRAAQQQVNASEAKKDSSAAERGEKVVSVDQAIANRSKAANSIPVLGVLISQRPTYQSSVDKAALDLHHTRIYAPFGGCVTALNTAVGAYAKPGSALFTLIDENSWYVDADYREAQLAGIRPGMHADVVLMTDPDHVLAGMVQSIGSGVISSDSSEVGGTPGSPGSLPVVQRSLNWVRLASRYPVRVHFQPRDPQLLRVGATADVVIHR